MKRPPAHGWRVALCAAIFAISALAASAQTFDAAAAEAEGLPTPGVDSRELIGDPAGAPLEGELLITKLDEITALMRCPVCQGLSVADSPVASALAIREEVRSLLKEGYTEEQIFDYFEGAYGEFIRLSPRARGFNLVVWIAPVVMVLIGIWLVLVRTRRPRTATAGAEIDEGLEAFRERVRREVGYASGGGGESA